MLRRVIAWSPFNISTTVFPYHCQHFVGAPQFPPPLHIAHIPPPSRISQYPAVKGPLKTHGVKNACHPADDFWRAEQTLRSKTAVIPRRGGWERVASPPRMANLEVGFVVLQLELRWHKSFSTCWNWWDETGVKQWQGRRQILGGEWQTAWCTTAY